MICILMGVSGTGKSTIGKLLSQKLGWKFYDADDFHSEANISKMKQGIPLEDSDRLPWLQAIRAKIEAIVARQDNGIFACSALKQSYRELLQGNDPQVAWIYLKGSYQQLWQRMQDRPEHFMKPEMLQSQLDTLEIPQDALTVDIALNQAEIVDRIAKYLQDLADLKPGKLR
ncbi:gluconokinase [Merismopedia glauca]|uniref:Gluconokinase n=1 Tax=Merismopedia glauca CCAP 1448/3 TaxID=1296344 RepID=A0A2T1C551_9CYAN|nr:gluconokinase [Merismopedia glauca]PSB03288.1 gluconate kinase [Merismopedia glauca CCAP 1448/3]